MPARRSISSASRRAAESTYAGIVRLVDGRAAFARADVAPRRPLRHGVSRGDRRARGSSLALERRPDPGRRRAGGGDAVSAHPRGAGRDRVRTVARRQARHPDQGRPRARDLGAGAFAGDRQDRDLDAWPRLALSRTRLFPDCPPTKCCGSPLRSIRRRSTSSRKPSWTRRGSSGLALALPADVIETPGEGIEGRVDGHHRDRRRRCASSGASLPQSDHPGVRVGAAGPVPPRSRSGSMASSAGVFLLRRRAAVGYGGLAAQPARRSVSSGSCSPPATGATWPRWWCRGLSIDAVRSELTPTRRPWWCCPSARMARS